MEIQVSSGQGPEECELAVGKLLTALRKEFPELEILETIHGRKAGCYRSVRLGSQEDLSFLEGSVKWICQSPFRPAHKRKNWFVDISLCAEAPVSGYEEGLIRFETFKSGGKGGQHVNKVETGVRVIHLPTGISVVTTEARSQHLNKKIALKRLGDLLIAQEQIGAELVKALNRLEHLRIERGNPNRVYQGLEFRRIV